MALFAANSVAELLICKAERDFQRIDWIGGCLFAHSGLFTQCEPNFKSIVRLMRNDRFRFGCQTIHMGKNRDRRNSGWYAKEWLNYKNLRQADVVARTSFNKGQVSEYVNGTRRWNQDVLEAFAFAIGIDRADLLRPPQAVENELSAYLMKLDDRRRAQALRIIKAMSEEEAA